MDTASQGQRVFRPMFVHAVVFSPRSEEFFWGESYFRQGQTSLIPTLITGDIVRTGKFRH